MFFNAELWYQYIVFIIIENIHQVLWIQLRTDKIWLLRHFDYLLHIKEKRNDKNVIISHLLQKDSILFLSFISAYTYFSIP